MASIAYTMGPTRKALLQQFKEAVAKLKTEILSPRHIAGFLAELEERTVALDRALKDAEDTTGDGKAGALMRAVSCADAASQEDICDPRGIDRYIEVLEEAKTEFRRALGKLYRGLLEEAEFVSLTEGPRVLAVVDAVGQPLTRALMATALDEVPKNLKGHPDWSFLAKPWIVDDFRKALTSFKSDVPPVDVDDSWEQVALRKNNRLPPELVVLTHPEGVIQITNVGVSTAAIPEGV